MIKHLFIERRLEPLNLHLNRAAASGVHHAIMEYGDAIRDIAAAGIFAGDLLVKHFGVTSYGRVVFYDYDEIVPLTACRFRKIPQARTDMEALSDEPWFFVGDGDVFPEEFSRFLGLSPEHRELFLSCHADLLTPDFWTAVQEEIRDGRIRHIRPYHDRYRLSEAES